MDSDDDERLSVVDGDVSSSCVSETDDEARTADVECPICQCHMRRPMATPDCCDHVYCLRCIKLWSRTGQTVCPMDRRDFNLLLVRRSLSGPVTNRLSVLAKPHQSDDDEDVSDSDTNCEICGLANRPHVLLLCDRCDRAYHTDCVGLPAVPDGQWFCSTCSQAHSRLDQTLNDVAASVDAPLSLPNRSRLVTSRPTTHFARSMLRRFRQRLDVLESFFDNDDSTDDGDVRYSLVATTTTRRPSRQYRKRRRKTRRSCKKDASSSGGRPSCRAAVMRSSIRDVGFRLWDDGGAGTDLYIDEAANSPRPTPPPSPQRAVRRQSSADGDVLTEILSLQTIHHMPASKLRVEKGRLVARRPNTSLMKSRSEIDIVHTPASHLPSRSAPVRTCPMQSENNSLAQPPPDNNDTTNTSGQSWQSNGRVTSNETGSGIDGGGANANDEGTGEAPYNPASPTYSDMFIESPEEEPRQQSDNDETAGSVGQPASPPMEDRAAPASPVATDDLYGDLITDKERVSQDTSQKSNVDPKMAENEVDDASTKKSKDKEKDKERKKKKKHKHGDASDSGSGKHKKHKRRKGSASQDRGDAAPSKRKRRRSRSNERGHESRNVEADRDRVQRRSRSRPEDESRNTETDKEKRRSRSRQDGESRRSRRDSRRSRSRDRRRRPSDRSPGEPDRDTTRNVDHRDRRHANSRERRRRSRSRDEHRRRSRTRSRSRDRRRITRSGERRRSRSPDRRRSRRTSKVDDAPSNETDASLVDLVPGVGDDKESNERRSRHNRADTRRRSRRSQDDDRARGDVKDSPSKLFAYSSTNSTPKRTSSKPQLTSEAEAFLQQCAAASASSSGSGTMLNAGKPPGAGHLPFPVMATLPSTAVPPPALLPSSTARHGIITTASSPMPQPLSSTYRPPMMQDSSNSFGRGASHPSQNSPQRPLLSQPPPNMFNTPPPGMRPQTPQQRMPVRPPHPMNQQMQQEYISKFSRETAAMMAPMLHAAGTPPTTQNMAAIAEAVTMPMRAVRSSPMRVPPPEALAGPPPIMGVPPPLRHPGGMGDPDVRLMPPPAPIRFNIRQPPPPPALNGSREEQAEQTGPQAPSADSVPPTADAILRLMKFNTRSHAVANVDGAGEAPMDRSPSPPSPPSSNEEIVSPMLVRNSSQARKSRFDEEAYDPGSASFEDLAPQRVNNISSIEEDNLPQLEDEEFFPTSATDLENKRLAVNKTTRIESIADIVKGYVKPAFHRKLIDKEQYKFVMKRCVTKVYEKRSHEIRHDKVKQLVDAYIKRCRLQRKAPHVF